MGMEEMAQHPFFLKLLKEALPIIIRDQPRMQRAFAAGKVRPTEPAHLSTRESYVIGVYIRAFALLRSLERMHQARTYMGAYPRPKYYQKKGLTQLAWLEYHYGYFIVTLTGLTDVALLVTNNVFRLGNHSRECKWHTIIKNQWVTEHGTRKTLERLNSFCEKHRQLRNEHVHSGKDLDLGQILKSDDISMTTYIASLRPLADIGDAEAVAGFDVVEADEMIHIGSKMTEDDLCKRVDEDIDGSTELISAFLDSLLPVFRAWLAFLRRIEKSASVPSE